MVVLLWASAIAAISIASTLWARMALRGVSVWGAFEPSRAFVGEDVTRRARTPTQKPLPLPIVRLLVRYPFGLLPDADPDPTALRGHRRRLSIAGRTEVELRLAVGVTTRGASSLRG